MKKTTNRIRFVAALAGAVFAAQAAHAVDFRVGVQEDPDVLDPHRGRTVVGRMVFTSLCDKLVDVSDKLEIIPQIALSWTWENDNKTLVFKLRNDVKFHDGTLLDAAAVKANLDRAMTLPESTRKGDLSSVERVEVVDPATVALHLKRPDAALLAQLSDRAGMILSPATFSDPDLGRNPVCSGPYKFSKRVQNDRIILEKFKDYRDANRFHFDRVVFFPIADSTVRLANLRAGDIDLVERLNPSDADSVKADKTLTLLSSAGLGYTGLSINVTGPQKDHPLAADKRVRQALQASIDRDAINEVIGRGFFQPMQQPFSSVSPYADPAFPVKKRDIARAKALLAEAGQKEVSFTLYYGNTTASASISEMIQAMGAEAGFKITLRPMEFTAMLSEMKKGNVQISLTGWSGRIDPDGNIHAFLTCKGVENDSRYCNPTVDNLLDKARQSPGKEVRQDLYHQAQTILQEDLPIIYLYNTPLVYAVSNRVSGFKIYPDGMIRLRDVTPKS